MYRRKKSGWSQHLDFMALDILCLELAFLISSLIRYGEDQLTVNEFTVSTAFSVALTDIIVMTLSDCYHNVIHRGPYQEFLTAGRQAIYITSATLLAFVAFYRGGRNVYYILIVAIFIYVFLSFMVRELWKSHLKKRLHMKNNTGMLIVTRMSNLQTLVPSLANHNYDTYRFVGVALLDDHPDVETAESLLARVMNVHLGKEQLHVVASRDNLVQYLINNWVDEVYLDVPEDEALPVSLINEIMDMGITVHASINHMNELQARHKNIEWVCGRATITTSLGYVTGRDHFLKRTMDVAGGLVGSLITVLLTMVLGPLIYIASPGPIFFKQTRIGENGRKFQMYKFRSMYMNAESMKQKLAKDSGQEDQLMFKMEHDPRIIGQKQRANGTWKKGIGGWIRDLSLDEWPQFFNVLKGDMSLVGTRPPTVDEWIRYKPSHRARMSTKPGITGLWQVSGRSKIRDFDQVVQLDREYIENWSLVLDFKILARTVLVVLLRKGAM